LRLIRDRRQKSRNGSRSVHSGIRNGRLQGLRRGRVRRAIVAATGVLSRNLMFEIRLLRLHGHARAAHARPLRTSHHRRERGDRRNYDCQQQRRQFGKAKHNATIIPGCEQWSCDSRHTNLVTSLCQARRPENSAIHAIQDGIPHGCSEGGRAGAARLRFLDLAGGALSSTTFLLTVPFPAACRRSCASSRAWASATASTRLP